MSRIACAGLMTSGKINRLRNALYELLHDEVRSARWRRERGLTLSRAGTRHGSCRRLHLAVVFGGWQIGQHDGRFRP